MLAYLITLEDDARVPTGDNIPPALQSTRRSGSGNYGSPSGVYSV